MCPPSSMQCHCDTAVDRLNFVHAAMHGLLFFPGMLSVGWHASRVTLTVCCHRVHGGLAHDQGTRCSPVSCHLCMGVTEACICAGLPILLRMCQLGTAP